MSLIVEMLDVVEQCGSAVLRSVAVLTLGGGAEAGAVSAAVEVLCRLDRVAESASESELPAVGVLAEMTILFVHRNKSNY